MKARKYHREARAHVRSEFLAYPLMPKSKLCNRSLAVRSVVRAVVSVVTRFFDPLTIIVRSDLSSITDLVPIISGLDRDTFTLIRAKIPNFRVPF